MPSELGKRKYGNARDHYKLIHRCHDVVGLTYDTIAQIFDITASRAQQITLQQRRLAEEAARAKPVAGTSQVGDGGSPAADALEDAG